MCSTDGSKIFDPDGNEGEERIPGRVLLCLKEQPEMGPMSLSLKLADQELARASPRHTMLRRVAQ